MNWKKLFVSPPPSSAWVIDGERVSLAVRSRKTGLRGAVRALNPEIFTTGPVGLQAVDRMALAGVLSALNTEVGGGRRPAVAIPSHWVRFQLLELDGLPKRDTEAQDVIRWRLKKILPVSPGDLRLSIVRHRVDGESEHVLVVMLLERAAAELEGAFEEAGVIPGVLVPRLFLYGPGGKGWRMAMELTGQSLALFLLSDGAPRMVRSRTVPQGRTPVETARAELKLLSVFLRENLGVPEGVAVQTRLCTDDETIRADVGAVLTGISGLELDPDEPLPPVPGLEGGRATVRALLTLLGEEG